MAESDKITVTDYLHQCTNQKSFNLQAENWERISDI